TPAEMAASYLRLQEEQLRQLTDSQLALDELITSERGAIQAAEESERTAQNMLSEIERTKALYENLVDRSREADLASDMLGYDTNVIAPPLSGKKIAPDPRIVLPVAAFFGAQLGVVIAFLREVSDKRFRDSQEIRRGLGVPIIGYVPLSPAFNRETRRRIKKEHAFDSSLCVHYLPNSTQAEAYRGVRAAISFNGDGDSTRLIQVTSASTGSGKSCVAANLAVTFAKAGKHVLLVDANFRHPDLHRIFCVSNEDGLAQMLSMGVSSADAVKPTGIERLSILPAGRSAELAQDLIGTRTFMHVLHELQGQFDVVLLDTPALLSATDSLLIAREAEGVILTIRVAKEDRLSAKRAIDLLDTVGANLLGVVVDARDDSRNYARYGSTPYLIESPRREASCSQA
ncbi:MAG: polysaccharide biosynthesis tyrosine autokinase, partial [Planctomycetales bacterium]|nr:polysaccharide biosynthesis tyrosine autokinase [Planctomycetales bacterium]